MSTVTTTDLVVAFGDRRAVDGVTVSVAEGEWLAVVGPNGAGKTSLLRAIAGTVAYRGSVRVGGEEVVAMSPRRAGPQRRRRDP